MGGGIPTGGALMEAFEENSAQREAVRQAEETIRARYEHKFNESEKEHQYLILKVAAEASIKGAAMRENLERLLRVMFLRETKERLKESGNWTRYCQETGVDIKNADYEIGKLGDFRDEFLVSFGSHVKYDINKIKYLTTGDTGKCSEKLGVTIDNGELLVKGERVPLTPEDVQMVVETLQQDLKSQEEKAAKEKSDEEKAHAETKRQLKKAEKELNRIRRDADKKHITPEEQAFFETMEGVKNDFETLIERIDDAGFYANTATPRMRTMAKSTVEYLKTRLDQVYVKDLED